jgi:putative transposase
LRHWVDPSHPELSVREQCQLLGLNRSTLYYQPAPVDPADLALMAEMDHLHTDHPEFGSRK